MQETMKMAGIYTGHALWSVSGGEILIPIVGLLKSDLSHCMERLMVGSTLAMALGNHKISELAPEYSGGAFIYDGYVALEGGRTDALIIDIRFAGQAATELQTVVPYRNARHPNGFAVHRPIIAVKKGIPQDAIESLFTAFFDGLKSHEEGAKLFVENYEPDAGAGAMPDADHVDFESHEFDTLKRSVLLMFLLVADADGKVDAKEQRSFLGLLPESHKYGSVLFNRVVTNLVADVASVAASIDKSRSLFEELSQARAILEARAPTEAAELFKIALLRLGHDTARASGGLFGFGSKVSKHEKATLTAAAVCLGVGQGWESQMGSTS